MTKTFSSPCSLATSSMSIQTTGRRNTRAYYDNRRQAVCLDSEDLDTRRRGVVVQDEVILEALGKLSRPSSDEAKQAASQPSVSDQERGAPEQCATVVRLRHGAKLVALDEEKKRRTKVEKVRMTEAAILKLIG